MNKYLTNRKILRCRNSSCTLFGLLCLLAVTETAKAEYLGLVFGRSANIAVQNDVSVEAGVVSGRLGLVDYQHLGLRVNSKVARNIVVFGDVGSSEFGTSSGVPYGLGALFHLDKQNINTSLDIAFKASYHVGTYSVANANLSISGFSFEVVVSALAAEGISGYVNFGHHRVDVTFGGLDSRNEFGFGAGMSLALGPGEAYAGFDFIDETTLGIGFRYFIK